MKTDQIVMCVVALLLGMLLANMLQNVCGCKVVEGAQNTNACYKCDINKPIGEVDPLCDPDQCVGCLGGLDSASLGDNAAKCGLIMTGKQPLQLQKLDLTGLKPNDAVVSANPVTADLRSPAQILASR